MAESTAMNSTDIQSKIQAAATRFVDDIIAVYGEVFANIAADFSGKAPAKAKSSAKSKAPAKKVRAPKPAPKAAKPAPKAAAPKKAKSGKRIRRSGAQLVADAQKVVKLLAANKKGLRIEQINKQLGTATKQLARPILKLLAEGKIKKTGEKRATVYFPG
jgi:3-oxoacyl-ACP reductase-like protein